MILKMRAGVLSPPEYFRVTSFPAVLGRGSHAHVWVPHPQISISHVRFERREDGIIWVVDLGAANGVRLDGKKVDAVPIKTGSCFDLGSLRFEVDMEDHAEEHTEILSTHNLKPQFLGESQRNWFFSFACLCLQGLVFWAGAYYRYADSEPMNHAFAQAVLSLPAGFLLALALSLLSRLHGGEYRYWAFFRRCSLALTGAWSWWVAADLVVFNLPGTQPLWIISGVLFALWVFGAGYSLSRLVFAEQPAQKVLRWVAVGDALLLIFVLLAAGVAKDTRYGFDGVYSVPVLEWRRPSTSDALATLDADLKSVASKRLKAIEKEND